jgi:hypothetical protein
MITMNAAYVITDKPETVEILKKLLPEHILQSVGLIATGNPSAARSLGSTIMSERTQPVALVLDAETSDPGSIQEKENLMSTILFPASADTTYRIFLSPPTTQSLTDRDNPIVHDLIQFLSAYIQQPV